MNTPDERFEEATRFIRFLFKTNEVIELRTALPSGKMISGRHDDPAKLAYNAIMMQERYGATACYFGLNPVARTSKIVERHGVTNTLLADVNWATGQKDIAHRGALLIDVDPERPSGVCSTEREKAHAKKVMDDVLRYLRSQGWPGPVLVDSGNGYHAYFATERISATLPAWEYLLGFLSAKFSTIRANVDTSVGNPGRVVRLPGSINMKGEHTPERPHRVTRVLSWPDSWVPVDHGKMILRLAYEQGYRTPDERRAARKESNRELVLDEEGMLALIQEFPRHLLHSHTQRKDDLTFFYLRSCPNVGRPHRNQAGKTALTLGDYGPGFSCFSDDCAGVSFHSLIRQLERETGHKRETPIWANEGPLTWRAFLAFGLIDDAEAWAEDDEECDVDWDEEREIWAEESQAWKIAHKKEPMTMNPTKEKEQHVPEAMTTETTEPKGVEPQQKFDSEVQRSLAIFERSNWAGVHLKPEAQDWGLEQWELWLAWWRHADKLIADAPAEQLPALRARCERIHNAKDYRAMAEDLGMRGFYLASCEKERESKFKPEGPPLNVNELCIILGNNEVDAPGLRHSK